MKRILHLLLNPPSEQALETIRLQAAQPDLSLTVVAGPTVPTPRLPAGAEAYRLGDGNDLHDPNCVDHARLLELIFTSDAVLTW